MSRPRRRPLSPAPLDDDDLLSEILLRLPPLPSSLPRASAVCRRWRRLASDPCFCRRFRGTTGFSAQLWKWNSDCDGAASWVLERSIELDKLLSLNPDDERERPIVAGFAEDNNVVLLWSFVGVLTLQLKSLHSKKLFRVKCWFCCLPFEGVYTDGEIIPSYFILLDYYC
ncbi:hypothetical protein CFC21_112275 [Triticum aestivum]|uniref:F-box domain-containing protein n=2 Tax=Triticum aestivum TaxID=4565 RepID=A0A9R0G4F9_WHEAT|nr:hypothetical protein [Triticum aestivum]